MRKVVKVVILAIGLWALLGIGCGQPLGEAPAVTTPTPTEHIIRYEVQGTYNVAWISMTNETGGKDEGDYELPYSRTLLFREGGSVYLLAMGGGEQGSVTCRIVVDDVLQQESSASGSVPMASCSAMWW